MLFTNQHLNKLAAARIDFTQQGMLSNSKLNTLLKLIGFLHFLSSVAQNSNKHHRTNAKHIQRLRGT